MGGDNLNRVADVLPSLAQELERLLPDVCESDLIPQIANLQIVDRCRCSQKNCASFYTELRPASGWPTPHRCIMLRCKAGYLILDVVEERIVFVEILGRRSVRRILDVLLPIK